MRSPLFSWLHRQITQAAPPALDRRQFLQGSAVALAASALPFSSALAGRTASIAIIGGGVAGLTVAYRLLQAGVRPVVFEASERLGGRMFTRDNFTPERQFCELGAEFINSNHADLRSLCQELGVAWEPLKQDEVGQELYYFQQRYKSQSDVLDGKAGGAFASLAQKIASDQQGLRDAKSWTEKARGFDDLSLYAYLESLRGNTEEWLIDLLRVAYTLEFGLEPIEQSALNLLAMLGVGAPFALYGESDEAWRIKGGSSRLIEALHKTMAERIEIRMGARLDAIEQRHGQVRLTFADELSYAEENFEQVIFALPFSLLRQVKGFEKLPLSPEKHRCVQELGYGTNAKIVFATHDKPWRKEGAFAQPSNGSFFTDLSLQSAWETSRAQAGEGGILTNYLGGKAGIANAFDRMTKSQRDLEHMIPGLSSSLKDTARAAFFWAGYRFSLGSYSCPKVGQVTRLVPHAGTPEMGGKLLFAGEHCSQDFGGYMNGAVQSANAAAAEVLRAQKIAPQPFFTPPPRAL